MNRITDRARVNRAVLFRPTCKYSVSHRRMSEGAFRGNILHDMGSY